ncbi:MAG: glycosyltransferase family 2 protein [Pseudomonadota bacterium]
MRNEAPFLLEWVAYHRMIGVNDPIVFSNACTDGTDLMLERLDELGLIRHLPNPTTMTGGSMHIIAALRYLNFGNRLGRSDWVVSLDVDEFINVKVGDGTLEDLFNAVPDANLISMSQQNFGHGGQWEFEDKLQGEMFSHGWDQASAYTRQLNRRGTKTLTHRSSEPQSWGNHSPRFSAERLEKLRPVNGSGQDISHLDMTKTIKALLEPDFGFDLVQLNHYALRAVDSYLLKVARGSSAHPDRPYQMTYWRKYDHNDLKDTSLERHVGDLEAARSELLQDAELAALHQSAVANARDMIADLKKRPSVKELQSRISRYVKRNPGLLAAS